VIFQKTSHLTAYVRRRRRLKPAALLLISFYGINKAIAKRTEKNEPGERAHRKALKLKEQKASFETVITSVNIKINKAFTCLVQKKTNKQKKTLK